MSALNPNANIPYTHNPKHNPMVKDSVFRMLFSDPKNLLDMYHVLHPEDTTTTEKDINIVTLEPILATNIINDLGFRVGNNLLILVEAQTKWSVNILVRSLFYLAETLKEYVSNPYQDIYETTKVNIPIPELYVIYTGPKRQLPDELSLQKEFFNGNKTDIELKIKIIYNKNYKASDNILMQYMQFLSILYEKRAAPDKPKRSDAINYNRFMLATITEAVDYCIANNILKDFLSQHRSEVIDIMTFLFSTEEVQKMQREAARNEGLAEGEAKEKLNNLRALISNGILPEKALALLNIPEADRPSLLAQLTN